MSRLNTMYPDDEFLKNISMCCRGITQTCNKMKWKFYEEKEVSE